MIAICHFLGGWNTSRRDGTQSSNLNPSDFCVWVHLKPFVYEEIREVLGLVETFGNFQNFQKGVEHLQRLVAIFKYFLKV